MPRIRNGDWIEFEPISVLRAGYNDPIHEGHLVAEVLDASYYSMSTVRFPDHEGNNRFGHWNIDLNNYRFRILDSKAVKIPKKPRYKQEREYVFT